MNRKVWLAAAVKAAKQAGAIQKKHLGKLKGYRLKSTANLVTEVDVQCEAAVIGALRRQFPGHAFLAEERGRDQIAPSDYLWIIDPLDGTTNYAHSYPMFCVSIALAVKGIVEVGVVYDAVHDELFTAGRGGGARLNGKKIQVSPVAVLADALLCTGFSYDRGSRLQKALDAFIKIQPHPQSIRRDGSAALDICYTACGRFDGFWEYHLNAWDVAAGRLILEEAGGRVSGLDGEPVTIYDKIFWGSNGRIHDELVAVVAGRGPNLRLRSRGTARRAPTRTE